MNLKKLLLVAFAAISLQSISLNAEPVATEQLQTQAATQAELNQAALEQAILAKEQIIAISQQVQKECSKQIGFITAILQQVLAGIQKGLIKVSGDKNETLKKLSAYISIAHQLQGMSVLTAEQDTLAKVTVILKNIIDRLSLAIETDITLLDIPSIDDLLVPDKNYSDSFDYILKVLIKNDERLFDLEKNSTSLGLTPFNIAVRATENFYNNYKWHMAGIIGITGIVFSLYDHGAAIATASNKILDVCNSISVIPGFKQGYASGIVGGSITAVITKEAYDAYIGTTAKSFFQRNASWLFKKYSDGRSMISDYYDSLKGIKHIRREGLATSLDNTPTLDDESLIGLEDQKREINKILDYLRDPELYIRSDNEIAKCCLLIGPSRTGKTAVAKAMAATINELYNSMGSNLKIKFIEVNYLMITSIASLKEVISYALDNAPCILFIDEIHLLGLQKTGNKELLNEFLTQLTELHKIKDPLKQVFIIGATNHPELLAPELFKHERFGKVIRFKKPGIRERAQFFATNFEKYGINPQTVDLKSIVLQTKDCDYGHLQQIVKDARFEARANGQGVSQVHLQRAINSIVHGIGSTAELTKDEAQIAAIDQAGKIVAHKKLEIHETIHLATISKVDGRIEEDHFWLSEKKDTEVMPLRYGTIISTSNREEIPYSDAQEIEKLCKRYLAGICAQKIILGTYHIDYTAQDYKAAFEWAQKLILKGLTLKSIPQEQQNRVFEETEKLLQRFEAEVFALLNEHKPLIEKLVAELLKERCITGKEIDNIVQ